MGGGATTAKVYKHICGLLIRGGGVKERISTEGTKKQISWEPKGAKAYSECNGYNGLVEAEDNTLNW